MINVGCNMVIKGFYDFMLLMNCVCKYKKRKYLLVFNVELGLFGYKFIFIFFIVLGFLF